jgi:hypothetical protein
MIGPDINGAGGGGLTASQASCDELNAKLNAVADKLLNHLGAHGMPAFFQLTVAGMMLQKLAGEMRDPRPLSVAAGILTETAHQIQDELEEGMLP